MIHGKKLELYLRQLPQKSTVNGSENIFLFHVEVEHMLAVAP